MWTTVERAGGGATSGVRTAPVRERVDRTTATACSLDGFAGGILSNAPTFSPSPTFTPLRVASPAAVVRCFAAIDPTVSPFLTRCHRPAARVTSRAEDRGNWSRFA